MLRRRLGGLSFGYFLWRPSHCFPQNIILAYCRWLCLTKGCLCMLYFWCWYSNRRLNILRVRQKLYNLYVIINVLFFTSILGAYNYFIKNMLLYIGLFFLRNAIVYRLLLCHKFLVSMYPYSITCVLCIRLHFSYWPSGQHILNKWEGELGFLY